MLSTLQSKYKPKQQPQLPNENVSPDAKLKDPKYYKQQAEYLFWAWFQNLTIVGFDRSAQFELNRLFAQGSQPVGRYQDILCPLNPKTNKRATWGYETISWRIFSVMPNIRAEALSRLSKIDFAVNAYGIDELSNNERNMLKLKTLAQAKYADEYAAMYEAMGAEPPQQQLPYQPNTIEDLDMMSELGSFQLGAEIAMEKKVHKSLDESKWKTIKQQLDEDAIDCGMVVTKDYQDPVTGTPMARYVNPGRWLARSTRSNTFENLTSCAEIVFYSLTELKNFGLTDKQLYECARAATGAWGNPAMMPGFGAFGGIPDHWEGQNMWNNFLFKCCDWKVACLDGECETLDTDVYEIRVRDGKETTPVKVANDLSKPTNTRNKIHRDTYNKWYRYKWAIGTDVVFDFGHQYDQVYDQQNRPRSSYTAIRISDKSIIEQCIATLDDLQITVMKLRSSWAKARPSGMDIDLNAMTDIQVGGEKYDLWQLISIYTNTGMRIHRKPTNPLTGTELQGTSKSVEDNKGTSFEEIQKYFVGIDLYIKQLMQISGISSNDGAMSDPNQPVGNTRAQIERTNLVLHPLINAYQYVKSTTCMNLAYRHQLIAKINVLNGNLSSTDDMYLAITPDIKSRTFDIRVDAVVDDDMVAKVDAMAVESVKAAKQGMVGITPADYFFIQRCLKNGQIKYAEYYLAAREHQEKQFQQQIAAQNQQMNTEGAMAIEEQKQQTEDMKGKIKTDQITLQYNLELRNALILAKLPATQQPTQTSPK